MLKTGDTKTFPIQLNDLEVNENVNFIWIDGIGFVADRNIKTWISYNSLEEYGYVTGKEITIDGERYNCRILKCTEWDDCMDYSDSDDVWHWENTFSWVRSLEFERAKDLSRAIRGYNTSSCLGIGAPSDAHAVCGFRPVLEILNSDKTTINFEKWKANLEPEHLIIDERIVNDNGEVLIEDSKGMVFDCDNCPAEDFCEGADNCVPEFLKWAKGSANLREGEK